MTQQLGTRHDGEQGPTGTADVVLPSPRRGVEPHEARPFAHGSVDVVIPAPRTDAWTPEEVRAPEPPPSRTSTASGSRTTVLVIGSVLAAVLLLSGLYTASVVRERSPQASPPVAPATLHDVTYSVTTGHGSAVVVDYSRSTSGEYGTGGVADVPSPWHLSTRVNDYYGPSVSASIVPGPDGDIDDSITCTILENGRTVAQETRSGPGASVSCLR